jgi:mycofactocin biosynthetic radical S-adenosylmethionine protein MftC
VQVSIDGATAAINDAVRDPGSFTTEVEAMQHLAGAGFRGFKVSVVHHAPERRPASGFKALAGRYDAQLRPTRLRPSGRGAAVWHQLHPTGAQQREVYEWLLEHGEEVLTGDSFFYLPAYGQPLPGLNLCGASRVVCLIDPVGDVCACPLAIHDALLAGNVRDGGRFTRVWREFEVFLKLRQPQTSGACTSCGFFDRCRGGCTAAKLFTGLPLDDPILSACSATASGRSVPAATPRGRGPLATTRGGRRDALEPMALPVIQAPPPRPCEGSRVAALTYAGGE